jgi:DNA-binding response OmpR family regulator
MLTDQTHNILIVDDDLIIRQELKQVLQMENYTVQHVANPLNADRILKNSTINLMILDLNMPGYENGKYYCRRVSEQFKIPIIIITASDDEIDELLSYELGAIHFMHKPFDTRLLIAKIRNILSITQKQSSRIINHDWVLNTKMLTLQHKDHKFSLNINKNEYILLNYLNENIHQPRSQYEIGEVVYNRLIAADDRIVSTLISRLRNKISQQHGELVISVRGIGYTLKSPITII